MSETPYRKTLGIQGVCERLGVSRRTVYNWIAAGKLAYFRTPGGSVRVYEEDVLRPATTHTDDAGVTA